MKTQEIKERVEEILKDNFGDDVINAKAKDDILDLINRVQFPDNYCKECSGRMFFSNMQLVCEDCGKETGLVKNVTQPQFYTGDPADTGMTTSTGVVPVNQSKVKARKNGQKIFSASTPGEAIRQALAASESGGVSPAEIVEKVPGGTSNEVNWV